MWIKRQDFESLISKVKNLERMIEQVWVRDEFVQKHFGVKHPWRRIELNHRESEHPIGATWCENRTGKISEFLRFTVPTDCVLFLGKTLLKAKLYDEGGAQISRGDYGFICIERPQDTFSKELSTWQYDLQAGISFSEQGNRNYHNSLVVSFPDDRGYLLYPAQSLVFYIKSDTQLPPAKDVHIATRWSFPMLMFTESSSLFYLLSAHGLIDLEALFLRSARVLK